MCGFAASAELLLGMAERKRSITDIERELVRYYLEQIAKKFNRTGQRFSLPG